MLRPPPGSKVVGEEALVQGQRTCCLFGLPPPSLPPSPPPSLPCAAVLTASPCQPSSSCDMILLLALL